MWHLAQALPEGADLGPALTQLLVAGVVAASIIAIVALTRLLVRYLRALFHRVVTAHRLIEGELRPNHGTSVKDTIHRIERKLDGGYVELSRRVEELEQRC